MVFVSCERAMLRGVLLYHEKLTTNPKPHRNLGLSPEMLTPMTLKKSVVIKIPKR